MSFAAKARRHPFADILALAVLAPTLFSTVVATRVTTVDLVDVELERNDSSAGDVNEVYLDSWRGGILSMTEAAKHGKQNATNSHEKTHAAFGSFGGEGEIDPDEHGKRNTTSSHQKKLAAPRHLGSVAMLEENHTVSRNLSLILKKHRGPIAIACVFLILIAFVAVCLNIFAKAECAKAESHRRHEHMHKGRVIYEWDQTSSKAHIYIRPPAGLRKKQIEISFQPHALTIGVVRKKPFLEEQFHAAVDVHDCSWSLRSNGEIQVNLSKEIPAKWPQVLRHTQAECKGADMHLADEELANRAIQTSHADQSSSDSD